MLLHYKNLFYQFVKSKCSANNLLIVIKRNPNKSKEIFDHYNTTDHDLRQNKLMIHERKYLLLFNYSTKFYRFVFASLSSSRSVMTFPSLSTVLVRAMIVGRSP